MFLFFHNAPSWLMISLLAIPLAIFLAARGINILIKGKSIVVTWFVAVSMVFSFIISVCFVIIGREIPEPFFYFTLPFGTLALFLASIGKSMFSAVLSFLLGVFLNACAFGNLIEFTEKLWSWRKQKLK